MKTETSTYSSFELLKDIFLFIKPYKWSFLLASFLRLICDVISLYATYALAAIISFFSYYTFGTSLEYVKVILIVWALSYVVRYICLYFAKKIGYMVAEKAARDSMLKAVGHIFLLDMSWHERENSGNKIKRMQNAYDGFNKIIRLWFTNVIEIIVNLITINIIISTFDRRVLFSVFAFMAVYLFVSYFLIKRSGAASYAVNQQEEVVNGTLFEAVNNIRTVKVMSMIGTMHSILVSDLDTLMSKLKTRIRRFQFRSTFLSGFTGVFKVGMAALIIHGIIHGYYGIGFLVLFNNYFNTLRTSVDDISTSAEDFVTAKLSISRVKDVLREPVKIDREEGKVKLPKWETISFKDVSFAYGENKVLENISFDVRRGEKVGIVGLSGAGKSTLFKLLLKEREEFTGDITFNDTSIKDVSKTDYFRHVSVVLQDTEVFNFSLRDNITITNSTEKENQKLLDQALATAHISEFLHKLPQGLDTLIGEKGVKLSGGERQRLGIARAIFKQPEILLLDEATSHLDLESEEKIRDSLHKFFENVTAIVIAHRLTTIKEMDKILVIEGGEIIESGSFDELYGRKGRFYELWEKQKL